MFAQDQQAMYQLKPSFFKIEWTLKLGILLQLVLVFCRVCIKNQAQLLLPDGLNLMLMFTTYYQKVTKHKYKNYCLAIIAMFFDFSLIYITTLFLLGLIQAKVPLFVEPFSHFTYMMIFSGSLYLLESVINYYTYREYKAIVYEINQQELHQQQQIAQNDLPSESADVLQNGQAPNPRHQQGSINQNQPQGDYFE